MKHARAVKLALECIEQERKRLAIDANLYAQGLADTPTARAAYDRRRELATAAEVLGQRPLFEQATRG